MEDSTMPTVNAKSHSGPPTPLDLDSLPPFVTKRELLQLLRVAERTLDRWVQADEFPRPTRYGCGRGVLRWRRDVVLKFLADRERAAE
jgi:predicted DNA-binding transcriptional regulator AlpA